MRSHSFNILSLAVVVLVVVIAIVFMLAVNQTRRHRGHGIQQSTQMRGIHQGLVTFANSNKNWFPGMNPDGTSGDLSVENRYQILIEGYFFTPEYAISPAETDQAIQPWDETGVVTSQNYSYAMLQVPEEGARREQWNQTLNSQAIVLSDRNIGTTAKPRSIHSDGPNDDWRGQVLWNDNHVGFENSHLFETRYSGGAVNPADHLFAADGPDDAYLIHTGN